MKFIFLLLFSLNAWAGFPPTSTKGSADSSFLTTFQFSFPNVTMTHSGTTATFGVVGIASGGTNNGSLAVTNGGVIYSDGSKLVNTGAGSSGQVLQSAGAGAPTWVNSVGTLSSSNLRLEYMSFGASGGSAGAPTNCTSTPCTLYTNSGGFSSVTKGATGSYTINFTASTWSSVPTCVWSFTNWTSGTSSGICQQTAGSTSSLSLVCYTTTGAQDAALNVHCVGPR